VSSSTTTTAPDTRIDSGPADHSTTGPSVVFGYSSPDGSAAGYVCTLDGHPVATGCPGSDQTGGTLPLTGLADGSHTFTVAAFDSSGAADASPASRTWTVSSSTTTPAPDTRIDSGPADQVTTGKSVVFGYSSPDASAVGYACTLDGHPLATGCPGSDQTGATVPLTGLGDGSHTFTVAAFDSSGAADASPASRTWTVDGSSHIVVGPLASPQLKVTKARLRVKAVRVAGTAVAAATGKVTVRYAAKVGGKRRVVTKRVVLKTGTFRATLRLKPRMRRARRGLVTVSYPGDSAFRAQSLKHQVHRAARHHARAGIAGLTGTSVSVSVDGPGHAVGRVGSRAGAMLAQATAVPRVKVGFGAALKLTGSLTDAAGQPVAGQQVAVSREFRGGFPPEDLGSVTTDATGTFTYTLPQGPSALVRFVFAGTDVLGPSEADIQTLVGAPVTLKATAKHRHNRRKASYRLTGLLAGTPLPATGKTVLIQVRKAKTWHTIKRLHTTAAGTYTTKLTITLRRRARHLKVRAVAPLEQSYPYQKGTSTTLTLHIRAKR
jgi:hypothetical protein